MIVDLRYNDFLVEQMAASALTTGKAYLHVTFEYDQRLVAEMRSMQGSIWNQWEKAWYVPFRLEFVERLQQLGAVFTLRALDAVKLYLPREFSAALLQRVRQAVAHATQLPLPPIAGLRRELLPYQRAGVAAMQASGGRVLLADEMGLGKTIQAIGFCHVNRFEKVIVICPLSAMYNWAYEIQAALGPERIFMIRGSRQAHLPDDARWYLINYDIVDKHKQALRGLNAPCVILDEAHYIKNKAAKRTKACLEVAQRSPHVLALTGTPVLNRVVEFWTVLHLLDPVTFADRKTFIQNYCPSTTAKHEWDDDRVFRASTNLDALRELLERTVLIRRTKAEVLPQLPPKRRSAVLLDIANRAEYEAAEHELRTILEESNMSILDALYQYMCGHRFDLHDQEKTILSLIERARDYALRGKYGQCVDWIREFLDTTDQKLVVFAHHRWVIEALQRDLMPYGCVTLYGEDSVTDRNRAKEQFCSDPKTRVIVAGLEVGSESHTLTAASTAAFIELPWQPAKATQAEDRIHRIGQTAQSVQIYHLVAVGTIEEAMANLLRKKQAVIEQVLPAIHTVEDASIEQIQHFLNAYLKELGLRVVREDEWTHVASHLHGVPKAS